MRIRIVDWPETRYPHGIQLLDLDDQLNRLRLPPVTRVESGTHDKPVIRTRLGAPMRHERIVPDAAIRIECQPYEGQRMLPWRLTFHGLKDALSDLQVLGGSQEFTLRVALADSPSAVSGSSSPADDLSDEADAIGRAVGQGIGVDPAVRRAIENRAMTSAKEFYEAQGFVVEDVSARQPYDLNCTRAGESPRHVEVKGTQTLGDAVLLTPGEVRFARDHRGSIALFVLHSILVSTTPAGPVASGGIQRVIEPWEPSDECLKPTGFLYTLPE